MEQAAKRKNFLAILAVYFAANAIFIMSPAMNAIATQLYPNEPYSNILLISTISSLCMIPGSLMAGALLSKVGFRTMALISMGGIVVCGVLPAFVSSLTAVYVLRGIVGFCIGIGFPLQSTLALQLFDDRERPRVLGMATVSLAAGSIIFMVFSGLLSDIDARYAFLFHAILLLPLAVVLVNLREPGQNAAASRESASAAPAQGPMPVYAVFTAVMFAVIFFAFYPVLLNMSSICANENIGGSVVAGMLLAVYTVGNMVGGFLFAPLSRAAGRLVVPIGLGIWIAGSGCIAFGRTVPLIILGAILSGTAVQTVWPGTVNAYSEYVPKNKQSMAAALFSSGMNIGCFLTTFFISAVADYTGDSDPRLPVIYGFFIVLAFSLVWAVVEILRSNKRG